MSEVVRRGGGADRMARFRQRNSDYFGCFRPLHRIY